MEIRFEHLRKIIDLRFEAMLVSNTDLHQRLEAGIDVHMIRTSATQDQILDLLQDENHEDNDSNNSQGNDDYNISESPASSTLRND